MCVRVFVCERVCACVCVRGERAGRAASAEGSISRRPVGRDDAIRYTFLRCLQPPPPRRRPRHHHSHHHHHLSFTQRWGDSPTSTSCLWTPPYLQPVSEVSLHMSVSVVCLCVCVLLKRRGRHACAMYMVDTCCVCCYYRGGMLASVPVVSKCSYGWRVNCTRCAISRKCF